MAYMTTYRTKLEHKENGRREFYFLVITLFIKGFTGYANV